MSSNAIVMEGGGFYNAHSQLQNSAIRFGLPLLRQAIDHAPRPEPGQAFVAADYGSSEGRNSMEVMRIVVQDVRGRMGADMPVSIVHIDQPGNDFRSLFNLLHASPASYLHNTAGVFAYATGWSFFEQLFPEHHVHLGWSAIAVHWLSRLPAAVPGHITTAAAPAPLMARLAEQAEADWRRFLEHRAAELKSQARLIVLAGSADEQGCYGGEGLYDLANLALEQLVTDGVLAAEEHARMTVPAYHRTMEEFLTGFEADSLRDRLSVEFHDQVILPDPLWERHAAAGDIEAFATNQTAWLRAWSEPSLFKDLNADRDPAARTSIIEAYYSRVRDLILRTPSAARCSWRMARLLIVKH